MGSDKAKRAVKTHTKNLAQLREFGRYLCLALCALFTENESRAKSERANERSERTGRATEPEKETELRSRETTNTKNYSFFSAVSNADKFNIVDLMEYI